MNFIVALAVFMANFFGPNYRYATASNELNFMGAVKKYFDEFTFNCNEDTKRSFFLDCTKRIFPLINANKNISSYTIQILLFLERSRQ